MKRKNSIALVATFLISSFWAQAQITFSPYSVFGIGDIQSRAMSHQGAMGGVGIGAPSFYHINSMNPALLTYNRLTAFEIGLEGESRTSATSVDSQTNGSGGFKYLSFAFPIIYNKMTTNIGVRPYSAVNYNFLAQTTVNGNDEVDALVERTGEGGLTEVYWSNGVRVIDNLSLGVRGSFLFGFIEDENRITLLGDDVNSQVPSGIKQKTNYKGFTFGFGAAYRFDLGERKNINIGATYDLAQELSGERLTRQVTFIGDRDLPGDTLVAGSYNSSFKLPAEYGFGISYEYENRLILAFDLAIADWQKKSSFSENNSLEFRRTISAGLGLEIIPKYNDVDSYLSRVRYRVGVSYQQLPYVSGDYNLDDIGINFGWSLPVKTVSSLNMTFKYGQRGTKDDGLVRENYMKFTLGVTLNDRWFIRRKYN